MLNPEEVLNQIDLKEDMIGADFGCGSGGLTLPLAKRLKEGIVYALDIQELPLSALRGRAEMENIKNIDFLLTDIEKKTPIQENSLDVAILVNVLFQIEDKNAIFKEVKRVLKKEGKLLIVDWKEKEGGYNSKAPKVSLDEIKKISKESNFKIEKEFNAGPYHYGIILGNS